MPEIKLGHKTVSYHVRESNRARRVSLKIDARSGLEVVLPSGIFVDDLEGLLRDRQQWILKHLNRFDELEFAPQERQYISGEKLLYLGKPYKLDVSTSQNGKYTRVSRQGQSIRVRLQAGIPPAAQAEVVRDALEAWYRQQAKDYIVKRTAELARQHGFQYRKITIKGQRTRWGSCSSQRNLNFNWRLMMAPPAAVDYVILHELCHLIELNHSPRFWALVKQVCPRYQKWIDWLKEHSAELYL